MDPSTLTPLAPAVAPVAPPQYQAPPIPYKPVDGDAESFNIFLVVNQLTATTALSLLGNANKVFNRMEHHIQTYYDRDRANRLALYVNLCIIAAVILVIYLIKLVSSYTACAYFKVTGPVAETDIEFKLLSNSIGVTNARAALALSKKNTTTEVLPFIFRYATYILNLIPTIGTTLSYYLRRIFAVVYQLFNLAMGVVWFATGTMSNPLMNVSCYA